MKFGYVVPNNVGVEDATEVVRLGVQAEALGFDSVWVNHHILHVGYVKDRLDTRPYQDALVTLTWLAAQTSTIQLGTSVMVMPYLHPMALAKHLATLDQLSGGRLIVGLGAGSLPEENEALGVPYEDRGKFCNEFLQVLRCLWTDDHASFEGDFFVFNDMCSSPKPVQDPHPMIVVGGNRPPALRRVARYGDGWHPMNVSPDGIERRMEVLRAAAAEAGREHVPQAIQVRLDMNRVDAESVAAYEAVGVTELVMHVSTSNPAKQEAEMCAFAARMFG
ncbi:MAG: LLM class F420-dependent oxidoreductase [Pseudomonadota bacterium]